MKYDKNRYFYLLEQLNYQVQLEDHKYWENRQIIKLLIWNYYCRRFCTSGKNVTETNFEPFSNCEIFEPEEEA
jgi:hypothetical protein